jgi:cerevisin
MAVAAGNSNTDACKHSPAAVEEVVTVGSMTVKDDRSYFSNYGPCVDVFAPGSDITAAWIGSTSAKRTISGTSMASPHVAGVMALLLSNEPTLDPTALKAKVLAVASSDKLTGLPQGTVNLLLHNGVLA